MYRSYLFRFFYEHFVDLWIYTTCKMWHVLRLILEPNSSMALTSGKVLQLMNVVISHRWRCTTRTTLLVSLLLTLSGRLSTHSGRDWPLNIYPVILCSHAVCLSFAGFFRHFHNPSDSEVVWMTKSTHTKTQESHN